MDKIKSCPLHGGQAWIDCVTEPHKHSLATFMPEKKGYTAFISTTCCSLMLAGDEKPTREEAIQSVIEEWNTRNDEAARQESAKDAILKSGIMQLKIDSDVAVARQEEREAIEREIEEIVSRYQTESVGQPLSSIRAGNIRGLRQSQGIIRKRGDK